MDGFPLLSNILFQIRMVDMAIRRRRINFHAPIATQVQCLTAKGERYALPPFLFAIQTGQPTGTATIPCFCNGGVSSPYNIGG
jgi:hypothetical protein